MKVLFVSAVGDAGELDIAIRAQDAGHQVKFFRPVTDRTKNIGKGLVEVVRDWHDWMRWADLVILADNVKYLHEIDGWRVREGLKIIGATKASAEWELNRTLGQKIFNKAHIDTLPYKEFNDYDAAIAYVKKENRRFVSKPCGDEPDKSLSYVAKTPADLVYMLERWKKQQRMKSSFILQDFVPGIEMAVGGFFGPGGFNEGWWENWEEKALMAGGTGPSTGEQGTTMRVVKKSKLADKVLRPLEDAIAATGHVGYVDVNCIIGEDGTPWPLEFTMRFGWPTFNIQQELFGSDVIEWLAHLSDGQDARKLKLNEIGLGAVVAIPDYPAKTSPEKSVGVPIYNLTPSVMEHVHPCSVMMDNAPQQLNGKIVTAPIWASAGEYVLIASGTGKTVRDAQKAAYRITGKIKMPSSPFWRPDIGARLKKELPTLQTKGYATGMLYSGT